MPKPAADSARNDPRVDDLRQRLRALGYLDAGVDRFVLKPARDQRRPAAIAALASVRIGLLAAALLGPAAAIGIGARMPGLVTGPRDAIVIAIYLALLFGVAAAAVSFGASVAVSRMPVKVIEGRARSLSRVAGVLAGGACLVYLTLWWRIASAESAALSHLHLWTAFAIGVAVAISLLLGHVTAITASAVMAARGASFGNARQPAWRLTAAAAVIAFVGAAGLLVVAAPAPADPTPPPKLAVVSPGIPVTLVAIDGFDPAVMDALAGEGRVPALARLFANGAARLTADAVRDPAREWTTIATGQPPAVHGVHGLETRRVAGLQGTVTSGEAQGLVSALRNVTDLLRLTRPSTASGTELRAKTMWEIAADAGLRAAAINWWATWPATYPGPNAPVVISDRATLRLERGGALDGEISPAALYERLRGQWPAVKQEAAAVISSRLPATSDPATAAALRTAAEVDALQVAMASRLGADAVDLTVLYLPGLDIAQHALLGSGEPVSPSAMAARLEGLRGYYLFLDALLAQLSPKGMTVVVAEPGRIATITHGLLAVSGQGAGQVRADARARAIDIAPTLLHILGIPISRELAGRPVLEVFAPELVSRFPVREVETYGRRAATSVLREGQPLDREMIERLRSLGYVR